MEAKIQKPVEELLVMDTSKLFVQIVVQKWFPCKNLKYVHTYGTKRVSRTFAYSADQDQTAQNVQSDLRSTLSDKEINVFPKEWFRDNNVDFSCQLQSFL